MLPEHAVRLCAYGDGQAVLDVRLSETTFFQRLINAFKYLLFTHREFPVYGEVVLGSRACLNLARALESAAVNGEDDCSECTDGCRKHSSVVY
jgi:hypothetical protein